MNILPSHLLKNSAYAINWFCMAQKEVVCLCVSVRIPESSATFVCFNIPFSNRTPILIRLSNKKKVG